jgi:hypothetical protein
VLKDQETGPGRGLYEYNSRNYWSGRQRVRRYHNSLCRDIDGGLFGGLMVLELFSSTAETPEFLEYQHLG